MPRMPKPRPPHLQLQRSRIGEVVWYVRIGKGPRIRIKAKSGTSDFTIEYNAAVAQLAGKPKQVARSGTLAWLVERYRDSSAWLALSQSTRHKYGLIFKGMTDRAGGERYSQITRRNIMDGREERKHTPFQANNFLKAVRGLFRWALEADLITVDPTAEVDSLKTKTEGFHAWSEGELETFEKHWPVGTRQRLAFDIFLYTGLRRGDAARLGRQHVRNGVFTLRTEKTGQPIVAPVLPALARSIAAAPTGELAFIGAEGGKPMTKESLGNWFRKACDEAGVPGSAHGLRKAGATRAANNGATVAQLEAIFGWSGGGMAALYTRGANRERLAREAMSKLESTETEQSMPSHESPNALAPKKNEGNQ